MTNHAKEVLNQLVQNLDSQTVVRFLAHRCFAESCDIPCRHWSYLNQLSAFLAGTQDARGIRQWQAAGRSLKSNCSAFYIFVPLIIRSNRSKIKHDDETIPERLIGFKTVPVFRVEDTEGKALDYESVLQMFKPETLPLFEVAQHLGLTIKKGLSRRFYGSFSETRKTITLCSDEPLVFLHELSHAIDAHLPGKQEDKAFNEIVAELSAAFLGSFYGFPPDIADVKAYLEHYAGKGHFMFHICKALQRVEEIFNFIMKSQEEAATTFLVVADLFPETLVARRTLAC